MRCLLMDVTRSQSLQAVDLGEVFLVGLHFLGLEPGLLGALNAALSPLASSGLGGSSPTAVLRS